MLFSDRENANTADGERLMVDLDLDDGLAVITIDRPHARNAISLETMDQLEKALDGAQGASALVITGAGDRAFVSGGDLKELSALRTEPEASGMAFRMRMICDRIAGFPAPTIAALNGHALGGGAEFAVAADIRLAADDVKIGFNQVTLEIMPAWGGAERLVALVGYSKALLLAGTRMWEIGSDLPGQLANEALSVVTTVIMTLLMLPALRRLKSPTLSRAAQHFT